MTRLSPTHVAMRFGNWSGLRNTCLGASWRTPTGASPRPLSSQELAIRKISELARPAPSRAWRDLEIRRLALGKSVFVTIALRSSSRNGPRHHQGGLPTRQGNGVQAGAGRVPSI